MSYSELRLYAEMFHDVQDFRISLENKIRSGTVDPDAVLFTDAISRLKQTEKDMSGAVKKELTKTASQSILEWQKEQLGIGEHLLGLLLGNIGDPYVAQPYYWEGVGKGKRVLVAGKPYVRHVGQLWAYCGHGDPTRKPKRGMTKEEAAALGNPMAKKTTHLTAEATIKTGVRYFCVDGEQYKALAKPPVTTCALCGLDKNQHQQKALSDYAQLYLDTRAHYVDHVHAVECVRCGPSGNPAKVGSPWNPGHQHGAALRRVGKEILRDLWLAARADVAT